VRARARARVCVCVCVCVCVRERKTIWKKQQTCAATQYPDSTWMSTGRPLDVRVRTSGRP